MLNFPTGRQCLQNLKHLSGFQSGVTYTEDGILRVSIHEQHTNVVHIRYLPYADWHIIINKFINAPWCPHRITVLTNAVQQILKHVIWIRIQFNTCTSMYEGAL
jgi:hypothetical protein